MAEFTIEGFFTSMNSQVYFQISSSTEGFMAELTNVEFFTSVGWQVSSQMFRTSEGFMAEFTIEGFFSSMSPAMHLKATCIFKGFAADWALEAQSFPPLQPAGLGGESDRLTVPHQMCGVCLARLWTERAPGLSPYYLKKKLIVK